MRPFGASKLVRRIGEFYLEKPIRLSVAVTTLAVAIVSLTVTFAFQLAVSLENPGFWIGMVLAIALPLIITPPLTGVIVKLVHQLRRANELADALANVDDLTKFRTRRRFLVEANAELEWAGQHKEPLVLLMLDIDVFKQINDTHGHLTGDRVLSEVADTCRRVVEPTSVMARLGGDELAVLLTNTTLEAGLVAAEKIRTEVAALRIAKRGLSENTAEAVAATVSIGCALAESGDTVDELVMRADQALYLSKAEGRNRVRLSGASSH